MKIPFQTPARKGIVAAVAVIFFALFVGQATREFVASWLGGRPALNSLALAAKVDSGNAEYWNDLGRYYDFVEHDQASAVRYYRTAVQLNPHSAHYWFDLAGAYRVLDDTRGQNAALEHAVEADPMTPDVAWEAANLYLVRGENEKALREFSVVMANDPPLGWSSVQYCWRINPDVDALLRDVIPHSASAYLAFLSLLETKHEVKGTFHVWDALMRTPDGFERRQVDEYFNFLIQNKEVDQAAHVWQQATQRFGLTSYLPSSSNLIVNGGFSLDVLNAGFDWHYGKQSSVQLTLDPSEFHSGRRSLLIVFDGPGISDAGIYQLVVVEPNTTYDFSAYYKNGELEGAGAPHITLQDMYSLAVYFDSDELREAGYWKSVDGEFTTGPDCKLVVLHIRRLPEGSPMRGKLWVDDFHLVRKPN